MSYCLNPNCPNPADPSNHKRRTCTQCGSELLLQGRYRATKQLGGGGFGKTFEIVDEKVKTHKVLKVLLKEHPKAVSLFQQEAKVLSHLRHPGIPEVEEDGYFTFLPKGSRDPIHCLVMEKIEGDNLQDWMKARKKQPITQAEAIDWLKQLVEILDKVHRLQYFHRDIKPQNIMRKPDGQLVLIDFGTAREVSETYMAKVEGGLNVTGIVSPGYTPPEQTNGKAVPASDFFALGRTFIYLLTGKPPTAYPENPRTGKLLWRKGAPDISKPFADVLDYLMAPFPGNRPQNPTMILQCLKEIDTSSESTLQRVPSVKDSSRKKSKPKKRSVNLKKLQPQTIASLSFPRSFELKLPVISIGWLTLAIVLITGLFTQVDGYFRYGFIPADPILILKSLPGSLWLQRYLRGDIGQIYTVAVSPNGQTLVAGGFGTIKVWDLATGKLIHTIKAHSSWVRSLAISPNGEILASSSNDKTIRLWDLEQGVRKRTIEGHTDSVNTIVFSPDGQTLASGSRDRTIILWNLRNGARQLTIRGHEGAVNTLAFSPDGRTLASASDDQTIKLWEINTGARKLTLQGHSGAVNTIVYTPDGQTIASASNDQTVRLWDVSNGDVRQVLNQHRTPVRSLAIAPNGQTLISGGERIILWDLNTYKQLTILWGHAQLVTALVVSPNGELLMSGSEDKTIKIWQIPPKD
ncbi:MAG: serine/threonine-protein kinase [Microcoleaceae cyanobacterium]